MSVFFIATPLDSEKLVAREIESLWPLLLAKDLQPHGLPLPSLKILEGGIELECEYFIGVQFNYFLKSANRVLLRLADFKARDLPKYYNKILSLPWTDYLNQTPTSFKIAASESRLNNEKRLLDSTQEAFKKIFPSAISTNSKISSEVFIRMFQDQCTISLNTSGEHLHKRGWMPLRGEAPLRETLAAKMLKELEGLLTDDEVLFDPMMGSGTILLEGRSMNTPNVHRSYDFVGFKKTPKIFNSDLFVLNYKNIPDGPFQSFYGLDIEPKMTKVVRENYEHLEQYMAKTLKKSFSSKKIEVFEVDSLKGFKQIPEGTILVCNPPYGERLEKATFNLGGLVEAFSHYQPKVLALLFPEKAGEFKVPSSYKLYKQVKINNGGIRCLYTVLTRS